MNGPFREASEAEAARLWFAVSDLRQFESSEAFLAWRQEWPWKVRTDDAGNVAVLDAWREPLSYLQVRRACCQSRRLGALLADVRGVALAHGFEWVLSPLAEEAILQPYLDAGMTVRERLVVLQAQPSHIASAKPPHDVAFRNAVPDDARAIEEVEAASFDEFWRRGHRDIAAHIEEGIALVATDANVVIGYTLTTLSRETGSIGSLAVHPSARRQGVARALLAEAVARIASAGGRWVTLCTQEPNAASRALYVSAGFAELPGRLALACGASDAG